MELHFYLRQLKDRLAKSSRNVKRFQNHLAWTDKRRLCMIFGFGSSLIFNRITWVCQKLDNLFSMGLSLGLCIHTPPNKGFPKWVEDHFSISRAVAESSNALTVISFARYHVFIGKSVTRKASRNSVNTCHGRGEGSCQSYRMKSEKSGESREFHDCIGWD